MQNMTLQRIGSKSLVQVDLQIKRSPTSDVEVENLASE
jgi:hypothetical protein